VWPVQNATGSKSGFVPAKRFTAIGLLQDTSSAQAMIAVCLRIAAPRRRTVGLFRRRTASRRDDGRVAAAGCGMSSGRPYHGASGMTGAAGLFGEGSA
jgi:hypothetical protein